MVPVTSNSPVPTWMQDDARMGKENIAAEDRIIPRVQLAAAISSPVTEGKVQAGSFYHTVLEEDLGECLDITILHHSKRYTLWQPRHMGGGILARASDARNWDNGPQTFEGIVPDKARPRYKVTWETGKTVGKDDGLGKWGSSDPENEDSAPAATLTHVLICVSPQVQGPFAVLLQRTGEGVAKSLLTKIDLDRAPIFGQKYVMGTKVDRKGTDEYHQYTFAKNGYVSQEQYEEFKELHKQFVELAPKVDDLKDPEAQGGGNTDADAEGKVSEDDVKY
jgi:hypothetical protein